MRRKDINLVALAQDLAHERYKDKQKYGDRFCHSASVICGSSNGMIQQLSQGRNYLNGNHAEVDALHQFLKTKPVYNIKKMVDIIVIRVNTKGELAMSKPCTACTETLKSCGILIRNIYYSVDNCTILQTRLENI